MKEEVTEVKLQKEVPGTPAAETAKPEQKFEVTASQLEAMMKDMMLKQFGNNLNSIVNNVGEAKEANLYDPEDVLDTPAVFFSHNVGRMYMGDTKDGKEFKNPLQRTVHFTLWMTDKGGTSDNPTIVHLSRYITKSKKEAAWLRAHSCFGTDFWDYTPDLKSIDMNEEMVRDEAANRIKRMNDDMVVQLTKENLERFKLKILPSYSDMRRNLLPMMMAMVNEELSRKAKRLLEKTDESARKVGLS